MDSLMQFLSVCVIALVIYRLLLAYSRWATILINDLWFNPELGKWTIGKTDQIYKPWDK